MDITISYFDIYNRAEPARMILNLAGVKFTDQRIQPHEWMALKPTMPNGVIPAIKFTSGNKVY